MEHKYAILQNWLKYWQKIDITLVENNVKDNDNSFLEENGYGPFLCCVYAPNMNIDLCFLMNFQCGVEIEKREMYLSNVVRYMCSMCIERR